MKERLQPEVATIESQKSPESEQLPALETVDAVATEAGHDFDAFSVEQTEAASLVLADTAAAVELATIESEAKAAKLTFDTELVLAEMETTESGFIDALGNAKLSPEQQLTVMENIVTTHPQELIQQLNKYPLPLGLRTKLIDNLIATNAARILLANESQLNLPLTPKQWEKAADSIPLYRDTIQELFRYGDPDLGHGTQVLINEQSRYLRDRILKEGKIDSFIEFFDECEAIQPLTGEDRNGLIEKYLDASPEISLELASVSMRVLGPIDQKYEKVIIEKLSQEPIGLARLFKHAGAVDLSPTQREEFIDRLAGNNPYFLKDALYGRVALTPRERGSLIQKTVERQPGALAELGAALTPEQQQVVSTYLVEQSMLRSKNDQKYSEEKIQNLFASHQGEPFTKGVENVFPRLDDEGKQLLFNELTNRFQYNFTDNRKVAHDGLVVNQDAALRILATMTRDEQQAYLPALIEHTLDPDFGNAERATALIAQLDDPNARSRYESLIGKFDDREQRQKAFQEQLQARSEKNRDVFSQHLATTYGEDATRETLAKIEGKTFVTVNIPASSIVNILQSGRMMSIWETKRRGGVEDLGGGATLETAPDATYFRARSAVERKMGVRAKGTKNDPNPIYGALGYENGNDEKRGSAPEYGDFFFVLKDDVANSRTSCTAGDSFHKIPVETRQFSMKDAAIARAKVELAQAARAKEGAPPDPEWDYVDVQILGGVSLPDIQSINIPADKAEDPANQRVLAQLRERFPDITITILPI